MSWADPDRWKHRRLVGRRVEGKLTTLKLGGPEYHFTELDGVTPMEIDHVVDVVDDGVVLWIKQSGESKQGFYIYYEESIREGVSYVDPIPRQEWGTS